MTDIVLNNIGSGFNRSRINNNFDVLEEVVNNGIVHLEGGNNIMRQNLDMNSKRLLNLPDPEGLGDPVPYGLLLELLADSGAAVTSPLVQPRQVGDGATTTFTTPSTKQVGASFFFVYLDGVKQRPTTDYSVNSDGTLEFTEAPPMASLIDITLYTPTFKDIDGNEEVIATGTTTPRTLADWTSKETLTYNTATEAKADVKLDIGQSVKTNGYSSIGDGGGGVYIVVAGGTGVDDGGSYHDIDNGNQLELIINGPIEFAKFGTSSSAKANAIAFCVASGNKVVFSEDLTINIPTDSSLIQSVFDVSISNDADITINIETGHKLTEGVKIINGDYSQFFITSTDATVTLDSGFVPVTTEDSPGATDMVFVFHQCIAPRINFLLDLEAKLFNGLSGTGNSTIFISSGAGIINAGIAKSNVIGTNFNIKAQGGLFTGAGFRGIWLSAVSTADIDSADVSGAGDIGLFASRASVAHFNGGKADSCGVGIRASSTSNVMAQGVSATGCTTQGMIATFAGTIYCGNATVTGCSLDGLVASEGGKIDARQATVTGNANFNVSAFNGGSISITSAFATGGGVRDLTIVDGGFIYAQGTTGTPFVAINTLTDRGVIFQ